MLNLELSALGSGTVVVTDRGVERRRLRGDQFLAYDEIESYSLSIALGTSGGTGFFLLDELAMFDDDGNPNKFGLELAGGDTRIAISPRFDAAERAIKLILARIRPRLLDATRAQLTATGAIVAGELRIAATELVWGDRPPLLRDEVESIELFDSAHVAVRVMKHGKAWPYASGEVREVVNVIEVLAVARELGYPVRATGLLEQLCDV